MNCFSSFNVKFYNVILLGLAFMFVFTAFQTMSIIEKVVLDSIHYDEPSFTGNGYTSLSIIYGVFAVSNWAAPSIVAVLGAKFAMVAGAITYTIFIASFLYPATWLLYLTSALIGVGAACIWTGQGNFLTVNSTSETIGRNSGIFWAMLQSSLLFGNLFVFIQFQGATNIVADKRRLVFIVLLSVCVAGTVLMFFFRKLKESELTSVIKSSSFGPLEAVKRSFKLFFTKDMLLLSITFFYTGIELGFFSGVYGASLGSTSQFGTIAKQLMGLSGIFIGVGEIFGGAIFGLLGRKTNRFGRDPIVLLGYLIHMISFFLIFINLPFGSPLGETDASAYIQCNEYIALLCSFLLGFGDSCFNTQIYSLLGSVYSEDSSAAFALFKFIQSLGATAVFVYSLFASLEYHLAVLVVLGTVGTMTFCIVEWKVYKEKAKLEKLAVTNQSVQTPE